jgi:hypothetical protein
VCVCVCVCVCCVVLCCAALRCTQINAMGPQFINLLHSMGTIEFRIRKIKPVSASSPASAAASASAASGAASPSAADSKKKVHVEDEEYVLGEVKVPALEAVFTKWMEVQDGVHHSYPLKVMLTALSKLVLYRDSRLMALAVQGYEYVVQTKPDAGAVRRNTRGAAREQANVEQIRYTALPLPSKIVSILVQRWSEFQRREAKAQKKGLGADGKPLSAEEQKAMAADLQKNLVNIFTGGKGAPSASASASASRKSPFAPAPADGVLRAADFKALVDSGS